MKVYAIHYDKYVDEDSESGILGDCCYQNEIDAYTKMLEEGQLTCDEWNQSPPSEFKFEQFPKVKSCSVSAEYESDYYNLSVIEMEVK